MFASSKAWTSAALLLFFDLLGLYLLGALSMAPLSTPCREVRRSVANGLETAKFEAMRVPHESQSPIHGASSEEKGMDLKEVAADVLEHCCSEDPQKTDGLGTDNMTVIIVAHAGVALSVLTALGARAALRRPAIARRAEEEEFIDYDPEDPVR
eukprot:g19351.t1